VRIKRLTQRHRGTAQKVMRYVKEKDAIAPLLLTYSLASMSARSTVFLGDYYFAGIEWLVGLKYPA
jgi:hypothetical protein